MTLGARIAGMTGGGSGPTPPLPYDAEIEWLGGTGTQYIRIWTGQTDSTFGLKAVYSMTEVSDNYPAGFSATNNKRFLFYGARALGWQYGWGTYSTGSTNPAFDKGVFPYGLDNFYEVTLNYLNSKLTSFGTSKTYQMSGGSETFTNTDFLLFKSYTNPLNCRFKSAILTVGSEVVRDLIPVRVGSVGYMYDRANPTGGPNGNGLYGNDGTGAFVLGPDKVPQTYDAELDYLESDGNQVIMAYEGPVDESFGFKGVFAMRNSGNDIYPAGTYHNEASNRIIVWGRYEKYNVAYWQYGWADQSTAYTSGVSSSICPFGLDNFYEGSVNYLNSKKVRFGGQPEAEIAQPDATFYGMNFYLFGYGKSNKTTCRIKSAEITKGNTIVRNFIPVRVGSGANAVGYMYDKISKRLFGNLGPGSFTLGPDKTS